MTGRERILAVLNKKQPDRIPFDLGGTDCSSIHVLPYQKLRKHFGLNEQPVKCGCLIQVIAEFDDEMNSQLGVDAEPLGFWAQKEKIWKAPFGVDLIVPQKFDIEDRPDGSSIVKNPAGKISSMKAANAMYFDPVGVPLKDVASPAELSDFDSLFERWDYSYVYDESIDELAARAKKQYAATDRAVIALWRLHYLQAGQLMRGYEQFLVDLMVDQDMARALMNTLHEVYLRRVDTFLDAVADSVDAVFLTDDLGTQESGLISPAVYKEMIYPLISEVVGKIKAAGKNVIMHSCGAVSEFIPFFIKMGVDAVNPVQVAARGMNPKDLVREFGKDIAFWGGGCDTQHALCAPNVETVRSDVRRRLEEFGENAHLVFTQVHNIQYDVPTENILAMKDEFDKSL